MEPVTERITLHLLARDGTAVPLDTDWSYRPEDPYAVRLDFGPEAARARWTLSREMLTAALHGPVGEGDIRFTPSGDGRRLCLLLGSGGRGGVLLAADCAEIAAFLDAAAELVPPGSESGRIDWDGELADLLSA